VAWPKPFLRYKNYYHAGVVLDKKAENLLTEQAYKKNWNHLSLAYPIS
jgi:hypothetical protein